MNLQQLKHNLNRLGLYMFIEESEKGDYIGICKNIERDAEIYIYSNYSVSYLNNDTIAIDTLAKATAFINSYIIQNKLI